MKVLFAAAECAPFFKTGGLGDVAYALPKELKKQGIDVRVVLPFYRMMPEKYKKMLKTVTHFYVSVGWRNQYCGVESLEWNGVTYYFIDNKYYFDRENVYGYYDDGERYAFFTQALIEMMLEIGFIPDILHVNDYHTAMAPALLKEKYSFIEEYRSIQTVLTIHNLQFQGMYDPHVLEELFGMNMDLYYNGKVRFGNAVNFLKSGIQYATKVTTVSPSYAGEIQTKDFGEGLNEILKMESPKLSGILNGIDTELYDPQTDPDIPQHFTKIGWPMKLKNKAALQERMDLPVSNKIPLFAMVTRLTAQKGCQLLLETLPQILGKNVQIVVLGTGDPEIENGFRYYAEHNPDKLSVSISFDEKLAQLFYAGSDLFLMPSAFEPCGLSQMIAMRYGSLPLVHEVGGLKDSVKPYNPIVQTGTGFGFVDFHKEVLLNTVNFANRLYWEEPKIWRKLFKQAMAEDFSWTQSGKLYIDLYQEIKAF